ncbi:hypothetical protein L226DRAFT_612925 [Lentinus tigrinus ALCF2SS1-7]|uniref:uncharacterized protein n=1 Tax=Lentinus tigrinus ALCF2SS1-7 TaxID=1328758 RepID=UPI001165F4F7|nr:hypothetical protein L226DRAFT_612925 [Lentinus tigrinus ALCF2SS1-7]
MVDLVGGILDLTVGTILVGLAATGCLFGVITAQTGWYFKHYPHDRQLLKALVVAVWFLDATHLGLYSATMYIYLVDKRGQNIGAEPLPWTANVQLLCNACAIALVQSFYASRIWTLSKRKLLLAIMATFIAATWVFSVALFIMTILTKSVVEYVRLVPYDIAMSVLGASTDVLLCGALVILLLTSRTGTQGADRLINKLMLYTVNTGVLTSVFGVLTVMMVSLKPTSSLFVMFYYIGSGLYSISLLSTLNARLGLRIEAERMGRRSLPEIKITTVATHKPSTQVSTPRRPDIVVSVHHLNATTTASSATVDDSPTIATPQAVFCDDSRCYAMPDTEFSFGYGHTFADTLPCSIPEAHDILER